MFVTLIIKAWVDFLCRYCAPNLITPDIPYTRPGDASCGKTSTISWISIMNHVTHGMLLSLDWAILLFSTTNVNEVKYSSMFSNKSYLVYSHVFLKIGLKSRKNSLAYSRINTVWCRIVYVATLHALQIYRSRFSIFAHIAGL